MSDLSPKQIAELIYQYERVLAQIDRGSLMLSPRLLKRVKDTITALAQVEELEAQIDAALENNIVLMNQQIEKDIEITKLKTVIKMQAKIESRAALQENNDE